MIRTLSVSEGAVAWYLIHVAVLVLACALMPVRWVIRLWTLAIAAVCLPVLSDLIHGNISSVLLLPLVLGWRWLDRPMSSIAIAIAASVQIALGAFLLWLLVGRTRRPTLWMLMESCAMALVTLPYVGWKATATTSSSWATSECRSTSSGIDRSWSPQARWARLTNSPRPR